MVEHFTKERSEDYRKWLSQNQDGYVWNVRKHVLHQARCPVLNYKSVPAGSELGSQTSVKKMTEKICSMSKPDLLKIYPRAGDSKNYCSKCQPK